MSVRARKLFRWGIPHAVGAVCAVGCACALTAIAYLLLLVLAIVTGSGPGGPFALPFLLLAASLGAGASSVLVLLPAVCVACAATRRWPWRPLVASAVVAAMSAAIVGAWSVAVSQPEHAFAEWLVLCALQLPLLCVYWLAVGITGRLLDTLRIHGQGGPEAEDGVTLELA